MRVFEDMVLRKIFGSETDEVTEEWGKLQKEEHDTCFPSDILRAIKSSRMGWAELVARMGRGKLHAMFCLWKPVGKGPLGKYRLRLD
jgi:hypothetical protein